MLAAAMPLGRQQLVHMRLGIILCLANLINYLMTRFTTSIYQTLSKRFLYREERENMKDGVVVSLREIYEALQDIKSEVNTVKLTIKNIGTTDERSRSALEQAKDAMEKAIELEKQIEKVEARQQWILGLFFTAILGIVGLLLR